MRTCILKYLYIMHLDGYITLLHDTNIIVGTYVHTHVNVYLHAIMHITDYTYNCGLSFIYTSYTDTKTNNFDGITHLLTHRHRYIHILK